MRFQESACKATQAFILMVVYDLLTMTSVCLVAGDKWVKKADMPMARRSHSTSAVNGKIYAIGGKEAGWNVADKSISTVEEYNPATDIWTKKADMPTARRLFYTSVVNGRIYAIGGFTQANQNLSTVEEYDPETDTWTRKADMPTARMLPAASAVNGKIYAIGGLLWPDWTPLSVVEVYDPATNTWASKSDMPTSREAPTSVVNGRVYAIGGGPPFELPLSTVEEYTPEGWPFAVSAQGKLVTTCGKIKRGR